jgi:N-acetylglutamate synthase-like GNAT family acetyltransferase
VDYSTDQWFLRQRREELLREAQERRLGREGREGRRASARQKQGPAVEVRWGLPEDEPRIAELFELNGLPRWVALEEQFVIAERDGAVMAAVRYRTEPKRLLLGLLVVDPRSEERTLAPALYVGARTLALEVGANDVVARTDRHRAAYLREAGYHRLGVVWTTDPSRELDRREKPSGGGRPRRVGRARVLLGALLSWTWGGWGRRARGEA